MSDPKIICTFARYYAGKDACVNMNLKKYNIMNKILTLFSALTFAAAVGAQQVPNAGFEDWSAPVFNKKYPPANNPIINKIIISSDYFI